MSEPVSAVLDTNIVLDLFLFRDTETQALSDALSQSKLVC